MKFFAPFDNKQRKLLAEMHTGNPTAFVVGAVDPNTDGNVVIRHFLGGKLENNKKWLEWMKNAKHWVVSEEYPFDINDVVIVEFNIGDIK